MKTLRVRTNLPVVAVVWLAFVVGQGLSVGAEDRARYSPAYEERVGNEVAAEVEKAYDRVDDKEALAKLQQMADAIAANTARPEVRYDVRLVREKQPGEEPEVNAFSIPGGIIYVTEGLVKAVHSDHELAGVMAHEISHNCTYDGLVQAERAGKIMRGEMAAILAAILVGGLNNDAWAHVMQAGMLYRHSVLGGYSVDMERAADAGAVRYLLGTPWDPVGLLTFMERLAAEERRNAPQELGIFQTHPLSTERVRNLIRALQDAGVIINRRHTARWEQPQVEERQIGGQPAQAVVFQGQVIFACNQPDGEAKDAPERAARIAQALTEALADGAQAYSFTKSEHEGRPALLARGRVVFVVREADAALAGKPAETVLDDAHLALRAAFNKEALTWLYGGQ